MKEGAAGSNCYRYLNTEGGAGLGGTGRSARDKFVRGRDCVTEPTPTVSLHIPETVREITGDTKKTAIAVHGAAAPNV
jgi:hypothetical protein